MIAYRLHFEEINLKAVDLVRRGRIGEPKFFNSSFAMTVRRDDIRTKKDMGGGTLYDIGVYCINAARYLFRAEPKEVMAISVNSGTAKLDEIDESTGALLRFDGERVAAFVTSFNAADVASYRIVGTKGQLHVDPAYEYAEGWLRADGQRKDHAQAHRQARPVRAGAAVLLGLHPQESRSPSRRARKVCRTCESSRRSTSRPKRERRSAFRRSSDRKGRPGGSGSRDRACRSPRW